MKSTYGTRASICDHFKWTLDYLENKISWAKVQRLMADMPHYEYEDKNDNSTQNKPIKVTEQVADDIYKMFNK